MKFVTLDVTNVPTFSTCVLIVLMVLKDLTHQDVTALLVILINVVKTPMLMVVMKYPTDSDLPSLEKKSDVPLVLVLHVLHNVLLVLELLITVPSVLMEEKTSHLVNAQKVNTKMKLITVKIVP